MKHSATSYLLFLLLWMMSCNCDSEIVNSNQSFIANETKSKILFDDQDRYYKFPESKISRTKRQLDEEDVLNIFELERKFPLYELSVNVPNSQPVLQKKKTITPTDRLLLLKLTNPIPKNRHNSKNERKVYYNPIDNSPFAYQFQSSTEKVTGNPFIFDDEHVISESGKHNFRKNAWNPISNKKHYPDEVDVESVQNDQIMRQIQQLPSNQRQSDYEHVINQLSGTKKSHGPPAGDITDPDFRPAYHSNESVPIYDTITTTMVPFSDSASHQLSSPLLASATQMPKVITRHILLQSGRVVQINVTLAPPTDSKANEGWKPIRNGRQPTNRNTPASTVTTTPAPQRQTAPYNSRQPKLIARYVLLKSGRLVQINVTSAPPISPTKFRERESQPTTAYTYAPKVTTTTVSPKYASPKTKSPKSNIVTRYILLKSGKIVQINVTSSNNNSGSYSNPSHSSSLGFQEYFGYRTGTRTRKYPETGLYPNPTVTSPRKDFAPEMTTYPTRRTTTEFFPPKFIENSPPRFKLRAENEGITQPTTTVKTTIIGPFKIEVPYFKITFEPVKLKNNKIDVSFINHNNNNDNCTSFRPNKSDLNPNISYREREYQTNTPPQNRNSYYNSHIYERNTFVLSTPKPMVPASPRQGWRFQTTHSPQLKQTKAKSLNEAKSLPNSNRHQQGNFRETTTKRTVTHLYQTTKATYPTSAKPSRRIPNLGFEKAVTTPPATALEIKSGLNVQNSTIQVLRMGNMNIRRNDVFQLKTTTGTQTSTERATIPTWIKNFTQRPSTNTIVVRNDAVKQFNHQNKTWTSVPLPMKQIGVQNCGNNCSTQHQVVPATSFYFDSTRRRKPVGYSLPEYPQTRVSGVERVRTVSTTEFWRGVSSEKPTATTPLPLFKTTSAPVFQNNGTPGKWQNSKVRDRSPIMHSAEREKEKKTSTINRRADNFKVQTTTMSTFTSFPNTNLLKISLQTKANNWVTKKPGTTRNSETMTTKRPRSSTPSSRLVVDSADKKKPFQVYFFEPRRTRGNRQQNQAEITVRQNSREREILDPKVTKPDQQFRPSPRVPEKTIALNQRLMHTTKHTTRNARFVHTTRSPRKNLEPAVLPNKSPVHNTERFLSGHETSTRRTTRLTSISQSESPTQKNNNNKKRRTILSHNSSTHSMSIPTSTSVPKPCKNQNMLPTVRRNQNGNPSLKQTPGGKAQSSSTTVRSPSLQGPINKELMESLQINPHAFEPLRLRKGNK